MFSRWEVAAVCLNIENSCWDLAHRNLNFLPSSTRMEEEKPSLENSEAQIQEKESRRM